MKHDIRINEYQRLILTHALRCVDIAMFQRTLPNIGENPLGDDYPVDELTNIRSMLETIPDNSNLNDFTA